MSSNILTLGKAGQPANCADGMKTASEHLNSSPVMGDGPAHTVSSEYTEAVVNLAGLTKKARPQDCARCISRLCMLNMSKESLGGGDPIQATHTNLVGKGREEYQRSLQKLDDQSNYSQIIEAQDRDEELDSPSVAA